MIAPKKVKIRITKAVDRVLKNKDIESPEVASFMPQIQAIGLGYLLANQHLVANIKMLIETETVPEARQVAVDGVIIDFAEKVKECCGLVSIEEAMTLADIAAYLYHRRIILGRG